MNEQEKLMRQIQQYGFTAHDLTLFLDTHPNDRGALRLQNSVSEKLEQLENQYNREFGPLTSTQNRSDTEWKWIQGPWPWEN